MVDDKKLPQKKKYEPPSITSISLRPEEAVLAHCKNSGVAGATLGFDCRHGGGCFVIGS